MSDKFETANFDELLQLRQDGKLSEPIIAFETANFDKLLELVNASENSESSLQKILITGGIATGKSTVSKKLQSALTSSSPNCEIVDFDQLVKTEREKSEIQLQINSLFKTNDTKKIAEIIFENPQKRDALEKILHPSVYSTAVSLMSKHQNLQTKKTFILEIPLLAESEKFWPDEFQTDFFNCAIVVSASENDRLNRLIASKKFEEETAKNAIKSQTNDELRIAAAKKVAKTVVVFKN